MNKPPTLFLYVHICNGLFGRIVNGCFSLFKRTKNIQRKLHTILPSKFLLNLLRNCANLIEFFFGLFIATVMSLLLHMSIYTYGKVVHAHYTSTQSQQRTREINNEEEKMDFIRKQSIHASNQFVIEPNIELTRFSKAPDSLFFLASFHLYKPC